MTFDIFCQMVNATSKERQELVQFLAWLRHVSLLTG